MIGLKAFRVKCFSWNGFY